MKTEDKIRSRHRECQRHAAIHYWIATPLRGSQ